MPADYAVLAPYYERLQMADFATYVLPPSIEFALQQGWMGRRIVDLGCGAGHSAQWLAKHGYLVTGVEQVPIMLERARALIGSALTPVQQDVRRLEGISDMDLALGIGLMNELESLKELELVIQKVHTLLKPEKWFIFDLFTIEGLFERFQQGAGMVLDEAQQTVFSADEFDYDRQIHTRRYWLYQAQGTGWQRQNANVILRAYPVAAVTGLVQRLGFNILHVLKPNLERYEPKMGGNRVIIFAQKR